MFIAAVAAAAIDSPFVDSFENVDSWTTVDGSGASVTSIEMDGETVQCMALGNGVVRAELPDVIAESCTLTFKALHNDYQRAFWVGLMNAEGTQGYAAVWDSAVESQFNGQGFVALAKFDLAKEVTWNDRLGKLLSDTTPSGQSPTSMPLAKFSLSFDKPSSTLTLKVNDKVMGRVVDHSFHSFSRVYVRGNERSLISDLRVEMKPVSATQPVRSP
jgi:hypothetical protein